MSTIKDDIMKRLKAVAVKTGTLCLKLPHNIVNKTYIGQIIRCSSSASANYRAACRGKSKADFVNKLRIAERDLYVEANELLSIIVASINTTLKNMVAEKEKTQRPNKI